MGRSPVTAGTPHLRHCYENRRATPHPSFPRRREPIPALGLWTKRRGQQHPFPYPYVACARPQCFPRRRESTPGMVRHHDTGSSPSRRPSHSGRESRTGPCAWQYMRAILYSWQTTRRRMDRARSRRAYDRCGETPCLIWSSGGPPPIERMSHSVSHSPANCLTAQIGMRQNGTDSGTFFGSAAATLGEKAGMNLRRCRGWRPAAILYSAPDPVGDGLCSAGGRWGVLFGACSSLVGKLADRMRRAAETGGQNGNGRHSAVDAVPGAALQPAHHHAPGGQRRPAQAVGRQGAGRRSRGPRLSRRGLSHAGGRRQDRHRRLRHRGRDQSPAPDPAPERRHRTPQSPLRPGDAEVVQPRRRGRRPRGAAHVRERDGDHRRTTISW